MIIKYLDAFMITEKRITITSKRVNIWIGRERISFPLFAIDIVTVQNPLKTPATVKC